LTGILDTLKGGRREEGAVGSREERTSEIDKILKDQESKSS